MQKILRSSEPYILPYEGETSFLHASSPKSVIQKNNYLKEQKSISFPNLKVHFHREASNFVCDFHNFGLFNEALAGVTPERFIEIKLLDKTFRLPCSFEGLKDEIESSKYIIELEEGWGDEEEGEAYDVKMWERTVKSLINMYTTSFNLFNVMPDFPQIYHGPNSSIDILWERYDYQILANFPKEEDKQISYYGEIFDKESFKGAFNIADSCHSLLMILIGIKKCMI